MTLAMVKVLPEPVTPRRTWSFSPASRPETSSRDGAGLVALGLVGGGELEVHLYRIKVGIESRDRRMNG